ncbi:hypothetical protein [Barnesiella intestinihominis]|uniref:hypothetical protein n=1 Tax=Barnesiella intestinihominis TaxID=487174 RepID=UPI002665152F|nr:hypothetical protein [Barnesiella intestinihominis]
MERKVGEIFEYNGEWYQCIHTKSLGCENCDLATKSDIHCSDVFEIRGECLSCYRKDGKSVIFKKLKKVGEPEIINGKKVQSIVTGYVGCAFCIFKKGGACLSGGTCKNRGTRIYVEIKQNKEDMEEKKLNLKEFDLEAAKAGKPVCTRDGRKARIICFDLNNKNFPIVAIINCDTEENAYQYDIDGVCDEHDNNLNLMMSPEKKEGWVNVYKSYNVGKKIPCMASIYPTKEEAKKSSVVGFDYVDTVKIEWEE